MLATKRSLLRRLYLITVNSLGNFLNRVFLQIKHANLPLLITFFCAFFTFMSALSGTGYENTLSPYVPGDGLVIAHLNNNASYPGTLTLPMKVREHKAFADHWSRFKKSLFSCSELSLSPVEPKIGGAGGALLARDSKKEKKRLLNMGCVKERLALVVSPPSRRSASTKIAREERVFAVSLNTIPRSGTEKEE